MGGQDFNRRPQNNMGNMNNNSNNDNGMFSRRQPAGNQKFNQNQGGFGGGNDGGNFGGQNFNQGGMNR
jgi:hypothetical protein